jgi:hypothetical protein
MALLSKTPRKQAPLNIYLRVLTIRIHPKAPAFMRTAEVLQGRLFSKIEESFGCSVHDDIVSYCRCLNLNTDNMKYMRPTPVDGSDVEWSGQAAGHSTHRSFTP